MIWILVALVILFVLLLALGLGLARAASSEPFLTERDVELMTRPNGNMNLVENGDDPA